MSPNTWQSLLFRAAFPIIGLLLLCIFYLFPPGGTGGLTLQMTFSSFILILFYIFFLFASSIIYTLYFIRGPTTTTILPCVSSGWYQIYTILLLALMLVLVIVTSIETRMTSCGYYGTWPSSWDECLEVQVVAGNNATGGVFGLVVMGETFTPAFNTSGVPGNQMSVVVFNGNVLLMDQSWVFGTFSSWVTSPRFKTSK